MASGICGGDESGICEGELRAFRGRGGGIPVEPKVIVPIRLRKKMVKWHRLIVVGKEYNFPEKINRKKDRYAWRCLY